MVDKQNETADTPWRIQIDEQRDHQQGGSGDQQDGVRVERRAERQGEIRSGMDDGMTDVQDKMTDQRDGMTDKQTVVTDTQSAATDTSDPMRLQLGIMIYQQSTGQNCEAKDSSGSEAGASTAQPSGLELDYSKPLTDALQNIFSNKYSIIIAFQPTSVSQVSIIE